MAMNRLKHLFLPLQNAIIDKRPFVSGTLKLPATHFSLFYKSAREGHAARFEGIHAVLEEGRLLTFDPKGMSTSRMPPSTS
jgi:hypothetical protein